MKNLFLFSLGAVFALGLSSCCSLTTFSCRTTKVAQKATKAVVDGVEVVTSKVFPCDTDASCADSLFSISSKRCVRTYCPRSGACGTTSDNVIKLSTAQGGVGSPHIGLVPTMKPLAP
jgi:hypothetical protein